MQYSIGHDEVEIFGHKRDLQRTSIFQRASIDTDASTLSRVEDDLLSAIGLYLLVIEDLSAK